MRLSSPPLSRAAALGLVGVAAAGVWLALAEPLLSEWRETSSAVQDATAVKERLARSWVPDLSREAHLRHLEAYRQDFLAGANEAVIGAELQARLRAIVTSNQSELLSAQVLPSRKIGDLASVGLRLQVRCSLESLQRILHSIETSQPLLFIDRAILRQEPIGASGPQRSGLDAVRLSAEIDVIGVRWPETTGGKR
jgi:general secretion pathway protein M